MNNKDKKSISKASRNYYLNIATLLPFLFLLISGLVVLRYHAGTNYEINTIGIAGYNWLQFHQIVAIIVIVLISAHLWQHAYWLINLISFKKSKAKNNDINVALFVVFILTVSTALLSWLVFDGRPAADLLREVHNKLGFVLIFLFIVHLQNYFTWLVNMTQELFVKK